VKGAVAVGLVSLAFLFAPTSCAPGPAPTPGAGSSAPGSAEPVERERFVLEGVSLRAFGADGESSSLSAKRLVVRQRTGGGGLLVYHDVMELLAEDAAITLSTDGGVETPLSHILEGVKRLFESESSGNPSMPTASGSEGLAGRVLFDDLAIRWGTESGRRDLLLSAKHGRLSFDPDTLILDGRIVMMTPLGEELQSPRAAFTGDFEGIHLPAGYELGGQRFAKGALVVGAGGRLSPATQVPALSYDDYLDRKERMVLTHFAKWAPPELRPLVLAFLAHLGQGGFREPQP
jgi:hypothetical protein